MAMGDSLRLDREAYKRAMREKMERLLDEVVEAVNDAAPGRIIRDSEEKVRQAFARLRQEAYEEAIQGRADAAEAAFPPSDQRGRETEAS
jgi:hypothetical protein